MYSCHRFPILLNRVDNRDKASDDKAMALITLVLMIMLMVLMIMLMVLMIMLIVLMIMLIVLMTLVLMIWKMTIIISHFIVRAVPVCTYLIMSI